MSVILQINKFFFYNGGSESYFFSLINELEKRGHCVIPFSMQDERNLPSPYARYFAPHIDFRARPSVSAAARFVYSHKAAEALERLLIEVRPDIAHIHNFAHQLTGSIVRVLKKHHIPIVYTAHDYQAVCPNYSLYTQDAACQRCHVTRYWNAVTQKCVRDSLSASALAAVEMTVQRKVLRTYDQFDAIIAPSQFMRSILVDWKYSAERVKYIPHGIEVLKNSVRVPESQRFMYVGRLQKEKGVQVIMRAMRIHRESELYVYGSGPYEGALRAERDALELGDRVHMMGTVSRKHVQEQMRRMQAVIVPSLWYENAPMVVYEALAAGVPVIGSHIGGIPELIQDGVNGYTVPADDPDALAKAMHNIQKEHLDNLPEFQHTIELHLKRIEALYAQCIQQYH